MNARVLRSLIGMGSMIGVLVLGGACGAATATPTPTATRAPQPTPTPTVAPAPTPTAVPTPTPTRAATTTAPTATAAPGITPTAGPSPTATPTRVVAQPTATPTATPTKPVPQSALPKRGGTANFAHRGDPTRGFDLAYTLTNQYVTQPIFGLGNFVRLCREDPYRQCAGVASKWESNSDFTQWTFTLRDGITWHDGKPFNAASAKEALELIVFGYKNRGPAIESDDFGPIKSVEALDNSRVRVTLTDSTPAYLVLLGAASNHFAYAPHLMKPAIDAGKPDVTVIELGAVGLGPFKLDKYERGSLISLKRFDKYWEIGLDGKPAPYLDAINYFIIKDRESIMAAIRTGRLDGGGRGSGTEALTEQIQVMKQQFGDRIQFITDPSGTEGMNFNTISGGPWQDLRVRQAVSLAYDRNLQQEIFFPGSPARALFLPGSPYTNPDYMTWPGYNKATRDQDLATAKQLMADAGYANGFTSTHLCRSGGWAPYCEFAAQQMAKLNITLKLDVQDQAAYEERRRRGDYQTASAGGPNTIQRVPWAAVAEFGTFDEAAAGVTMHNNKRVNELITGMGKLGDVKDQVPLARELERLIIRDEVYYIVNNDVKSYPFYSYVKGLIPPETALNNYADNALVWLDK